MSEKEILEAIKKRHADRFHVDWDDATKNAPPWAIDDVGFELLKPLLIGKKIIAIERKPSTNDPFPQDANTMSLEIDGGMVLHFSGWGYDACGLDLAISPQAMSGGPVATGKGLLVFTSFFFGTLGFVAFVYWWMFP